MKPYNKRTWLNATDSPSTGNVVCFDGEITYKGKTVRNTFVSISDCNVSARLHKTEDDSLDDFIDKMKVLRNEITEFIKHLES